MKLADYLAIEGNTATKVAEAAKVAVSTITRAAAGTLSPTKGLMESIYRATSGQVTPNDFCDLEARPTRRADRKAA